MDQSQIQKALKSSSEYLELRVQENQTENITIIKTNVVNNDTSKTQGISARSYNKGCWGFSSSNRSTESSVQHCIEEAQKNAVFLSSKAKDNSSKSDLPESTSSSDHDFSTTKNRWSNKEKVDFMSELDDLVQKNCKNISGKTLMYRALDMKKNMYLTDKGHHTSLIPRAHILVLLNDTDNDGAPIETMSVAGGRGQFEDQFKSPEELLPEIMKTYEHLQNKKNAVYAQAGNKEVILAPSLAGILAHEAIGHPVEADLVLGGSVAKEYLNKPIASDLITMVDFAHTYNDTTLLVPVFYDDEGTKAKDQTLIDKGILRGYLHNKESALHFGHSPTGNARAFQFSDEPLIRMRNTAILPGTSKIDDMISSIEDGYYLIEPGNGQADSTSEFMFSVTIGYEIKNGKIGKAIKNTTISGIAFDLLKTVTMVSNEMDWSNSGMCGKKQPIPVSMGGPAIKCHVNIGGR